MAYGARLESVLGASPRGFESPILRHRTPGPLQVPGFLLPVASRVVGAVWPDLMGRAAVCAGGRRPAREPSAPRASLGASSRSPARPCHRPPALRPGHAALATKPCGFCGGQQTGGHCTAEPRPRPLRLRGPRRSLRPGARPGPRPSQRASIGASPSRCSSTRPRTPSR